MKKKEIEIAKFLAEKIGQVAWVYMSKNSKYAWVEIAKGLIDKMGEKSDEEKKKS